MKSIFRYGVMGLLLVSGYAAAEKEISVSGYAGIGASRFSFQEKDLRDAEPLSATIFTGLELHRFLDIQAQISVAVKSDKYAGPMSLTNYDYLGNNFDLTSNGPVNFETDIPFSAAFFVKPKVDVGPLQLYVLAGAAYTHLEQQIAGRFDAVVTDMTGTPVGTLTNYPVEFQYERKDITFAYGAGLALNLGRLRLSGEFVRLDKKDASDHACHTTGQAGGAEVVYCDDIFNKSTLD